jgi:hypothetical protein
MSANEIRNGIDISTVKLLEILELTNKKGQVMYRSPMFKKVDLADGREDGFVTSENAWQYLSRNEASYKKSLPELKELLLDQFRRNGAGQIKAVEYIGMVKMDSLTDELISRLGSYEEDYHFLKAELKITIIETLAKIANEKAKAAIISWAKAKYSFLIPRPGSALPRYNPTSVGLLRFQKSCVDAVKNMALNHKMSFDRAIEELSTIAMSKAIIFDYSKDLKDHAKKALKELYKAKAINK